MTNQELVYTPILKRLCESNMNNLINSNYPYLPFIPVSFNGYHESSLKIFYVGIDTYYWVQNEIPLLIESAKRNNFHEILKHNNNTVTPNRILVEWYNDKGRFWEYVLKLHIYIRTNTLLTNEDLRNLSHEQAAIVNEIGWGNMNSIELERTLKKEEVWDSLDKDLYWKLKQSSEDILDPIKNLIQAFTPDYIIILGWGDSESHVFKGLEFQSLSQYYKEDYRALYRISNYKTKVLWSSHPSRFSYLRTNQNYMIPYVANSLKLF